MATWEKPGAFGCGERNAHDRTRASMPPMTASPIFRG